MIIGVITVYQCDGLDCKANKVVTDENEGRFATDWFAGLDQHFCHECRGRVANAAAIADQERRLREIEESVRRRVTSGNSRRSYVH